MKLFNTLSRKIEEVVPISPGKIGLYACGPTVYDYAHLGHLRKYIMDDVLVRALRYQGFEVNHVMNITDVGHLVSDDDAGEDKLEKGARKHGISVWEVAKRFEEHFWKSLDTVHVQRPTVSCRATDHIAEQIAMIRSLEEKGFTYKTPDGLYFDTSKVKQYGALARLKADGLQAGARVKMAGKKYLTDFALWKFSPTEEKRQMEWDSPWGKGFPGWHIECSAMSVRYLGEQFDIHTGGIDHITVHHPNEIAQSECATGKTPFVKIWVHHNFLQVEGQKMSKSLGNVCRIEDVIEKGYLPEALRLLFLGAHYRSEMNFTWDGLAGAEKALNRLILQLVVARAEQERTVLSQEKLEKLDAFRAKFFSAVQHDLNLAEAIVVVWEVMKSNVPGQDKYDLVLEFDSVLGLNLAGLCAQAQAISHQPEDIPEDIQLLAQKRSEAKRNHDYVLADTLRAQLEQLGWEIQDTGGEYILRPKKIPRS